MISGGKTSKQALHLLLGVCIMLGCSACSLSGGSTASSKDLRSSSIQQSEFEILRINPDPAVYQVKSSRLADAQVFLAPIQECGIVTERTEVVSVVRQLFVGLSNLHIHRKQKLELADQDVHYWAASANMDGQELEIFSFSIARKDCITDYVFWATGASAERLRSARLDPELFHFVEKEIRGRVR